MKRSLSIMALMAFVGTLACGCAMPSLNVQCSVIRGGGDISAVIYLEQHPGTDKQEFRRTAVAVLNAIETGSLADLPLAAVEAKLKAVVPFKYQTWVSGLLAAASGQSVDPKAAIGAANVRRLRAYVVGLINGADGYDQ